ncbi:MAG TPA: YidC/Oxa1 family insertase periplasmic-domain containing protein [Pyrinomonadaceae bacterium]|nr:YidC/Oxa1 family insertase periplasmic-domain containing protein [Pyrinomonadaceae bacterium]
MDKPRFLLALLLSAAVLFGWNFFFPVKTPPPQANNNSNTSAAGQTPSPTASPAEPAAASQDKPPVQGPGGEIPSETTAPRQIKVTSPLYDIVLDNRGAIATSWILKKNKDNGRPLYSVGGTKDQPKPLELISQERVKQVPREAPLRLQTVDGDKSAEGKMADFLLDSRHYVVKELKGQGAAEDLQSDTFEIPAGGSRSIEFSLNVSYGPEGKESLRVSKIITFYADQYRADVKVDLKQGGQPRQAKLLIGPSIGDQGIPEYTFYSVPPEGVATIGEQAVRNPAIAINHGHSDKLALGGPVDWAGIGDTYFAMVAVPQQRMEGLEYRTAMVEHPADPSGRYPKQARYLITAYVPISTDGVPTVLYVGPKDHYLLKDATATVGQAVGRQIDLEGMIDYGFMSWMSRPLAVPILWSIKFLYKLTNSYGIAIILFTIVIYSLFFPLKWRSSKAMKKAAKMAPRMKELQEKMKGMKKTDPRLRELQVEQMRLMKEGNPLGGCLPLLIQMPFLFALYRAITISIDFRQASFLWIPDLSAPEATAIHILPILMAGSLMVLQLITPAPSADPVQRKMMAIGMPLLMLWMLWSAPAGLLVYWLVGNLVGFGQQFIINRLTKTEDDEQPPAGKTAATRSTKKLNARVSQA